MKLIDINITNADINFVLTNAEKSLKILINKSYKLTCRSMKTIFLLPSYISNSVSFVSYQYVAALRERGYDVGITSIRKSQFKKNLKSLYVSRWRVLSCKILVTNLFLPDLFGYVISRIVPSIKWVAFLHCDIIGGLAAERKAFAKLKAWLWRFVLSRADLVVSPSLYALRSLPTVQRNVIIPHCLDPGTENRFRGLDDCHAGTSAAQVEQNKADGRMSYVFIGRDTPAKRLLSILNLLRIDSSCTIKVIGLIDFSLSRIDQLTKEELSRCKFYGHQKYPYQFITNRDVVVCPSGREGFGLIPLECMARGITVGVINEGVFKELYDETSIVYDRISNLPKKIQLLSLDMELLKAKFIGATVLNMRVDALILSLFGSVVVNSEVPPKIGS